MLAATSLMMGIGNLFPIPPLDGGRIVFSLFKGIGMPVPDKVAWILSTIGLTLLLLLSLVNMIRSIIDWFSGM